MSWADAASALLLVAGTAFFIAGTVGLLRLRGVHSRLHALTKADNVGLGLVALGLALQAPDWSHALKHMLVWLLVLVSSAVASQLVARYAWGRERP